MIRRDDRLNKCKWDPSNGVSKKRKELRLTNKLMRLVNVLRYEDVDFTSALLSYLSPKCLLGLVIFVLMVFQLCFGSPFYLLYHGWWKPWLYEQRSDLSYWDKKRKWVETFPLKWDGRKQRFGDDETALLYIWRHQFPEVDSAQTSCSRLVVLGCDETGTGVGSRGATAARTFQAGIATGRIFEWVKGCWRYTDPQKCPSKSVDCYFQPVSSCSPILAQDIEGRVPGLSPALRYSSFPVLYGFQHRNRLPWKYYGYWEDIPMEFSSNSVFWWQSKLLYFALQPSHDLRDQYDRAEEQLGLKSSKYISMHIRHGDKDTETETFGLAKFMCIAEYIREKHPKLTTIHILTEDDTVLSESKEYQDRWTFAWTEYNRYNSKNIQVDIDAGILNGGEELINAMINAYLAANADAVICTFSSNFCRLILRLAYGAYGKLPMTYSLDAWSHDAGIEWLPKELEESYTSQMPNC